MPGTGKRDLRIVVIEDHLVRLMARRSQWHDRRPGAEQIVHQEIHLVLVAEVFDHFERFGPLRRPVPRAVGPAMATVNIDDLPCQRAVRLASHVDRAGAGGRDYIFQVRENLNDFLFVNMFIEQDFVDRNKLFVADKRLDEQRMVWQWYVKSRNAGDYKQMVKDQLYHPPHITVDLDKTGSDALYLVHHFEGKPLVKEFIHNTLLGIEYLWGGKTMLETTEVKSIKQPDKQPTLPGMSPPVVEHEEEPEIEWQRVRYTMKEKKLSKGLI